MIVVTGATGALNGATVEHLLKLVPAERIAVSVRDVNDARAFAERGVEVRHGDYAEPDSLAGAFEGADRLLLVSSNDPGADAVSLHGAAIDAAVSAGVGRIFYTSHQGAALDTPFKPGRDHAATERLLAKSGVAWTSLRNGFYAHSLEWLTGSWQESGTITVPADGPVSWTARDDAAEAAAIVLAAEAEYDGPTTMTASAAVTFVEVATIASDVSGRPVQCVVVDPDDWIAARIADGQPEATARFTLGMFEAARDGFFAGTDPLLRELLGRDPQTVGDLLAHQGTV